MFSFCTVLSEYSKAVLLMDLPEIAQLVTSFVALCFASPAKTLLQRKKICVPCTLGHAACETSKEECCVFVVVSTQYACA